jgi:hypothetical protein
MTKQISPLRVRALLPPMSNNVNYYLQQHVAADTLNNLDFNQLMGININGKIFSRLLFLLSLFYLYVFVR